MRRRFPGSSTSGLTVINNNLFSKALPAEEATQLMLNSAIAYSSEKSRFFYG
ncbi:MULTISPECIES: hypothetical protein [Oscillatoriales]|uniref:hypothetical protein n=1 Tax=Oscillatoriales TaxID=1150 RepID=UPI0013054176|nr:hypothetical protein [Arthrospira platensis]MBD2572417.1 hypothetical protein [Arthrospira platensis FACHB-971]MBD2668889.1 hypothetical protein [Arthrospira platensis FACHB-439]MDF2209947.1 hypothetical protein [Arthrospira platensis NCB002]MDT9294730.1 hypothetical protein [Arthrospira platensis PCC 7345]MDT9309717.1 hypothetical protein [Limnospira sp. Paracas R14]QQW30361.1 hypothetical protein AP9108_06465 [Arthrospira sp. PCC 9108]